MQSDCYFGHRPTDCIYPLKRSNGMAIRLCLSNRPKELVAICRSSADFVHSGASKEMPDIETLARCAKACGRAIGLVFLSLGPSTSRLLMP